LLDLELPILDGVEALRQVRLRHPEIQALVFTAFDTDERILGAVRAGAKGYLLKGVARDEIFRAIREIKRGGSLLQPIVTTKLLEHISASQVEPLLPAEQLTGREMEVLRLLARGKNNKEIAAELVITERTVKFHVSSILKKFNAGNRTEAVTFAVGQGLIEL
jgi:DNA-binding NarL/FixJ family response regulator